VVFIKELSSSLSEKGLHLELIGIE
jgi:hypothetical protein